MYLGVKMIAELFALHLFVYWTSVIGFIMYYGQYDDCKKKEVRDGATQVLINQLVYTPVYFLPFAHWYPVPLPWVHGVWQLPVIVVMTDVIFYIMHRAFHHPLLYKHVHSRHHAVYPPVAPTALYSHPAEHVLVNLLSVLAPLFMVRASYSVAMVWTTFASLNVVWSHSETDGIHTAHHKYRNCNYGVGLYWMDDIFGTKKCYK